MIKKITYFIYAARVKTLVAVISPILICSSICSKYYSLDFFILLLTLSAALLIQIMTNFINDLYDFKKGADNHNRIGPDRMIQKGLISEKEMVKAIYIVFFMALVIGLYLANIGGWRIVLIGSSAFVFAYLYTATSFSIAYNGLGEIFVFLYFGVIASLGTFYLQVLDYNYSALLIGIICGCFNMILLIINNLRDIDIDILSNKRTLVARLGKKFGYIEFGLALFISHIALYFLSIHLKDINIFLIPLILLCMPLYIYYNLAYNVKYINHRALPTLSLYIILFTSLLTYLIIV